MQFTSRDKVKVWVAVVRRHAFHLPSHVPTLNPVNVLPTNCKQVYSNAHGMSSFFLISFSSDFNISMSDSKELILQCDINSLLIVFLSS